MPNPLSQACFSALACSLLTCTTALAAAAVPSSSEVTPPVVFKETFGPLPGGRLGVVQGGLLHCLAVRRGAWQRCGDWQALALPDDTQRFLGNQRVISLVRKAQIEFLDEAADPGRGTSLPLEAGWSPWSMLNGVYSTEKDMVLFQGTDFRVRQPNDPASNMDVTLECPEAKGRRIYGLRGPMRWALIGPEGMLAVKLTREPNHPTWRCVREPSLDWVPPQGVEEIAVIGLDMLASRTGSVIQFWDYRQPSQGGEMRWMSVEPRAPGSAYRFAPPELLLDKLLAGPTPEARSPLPLRRLDAASMQALIDRVVPARFAWADGMDRRFLKVAKASGSGTADEQLFGVLDADGKEIIPPLYAHLEHHASHRRFQVTLGRGKAARAGFLDEKGRVVVPVVYEQLTRISNMGSEPTVVVQQGGKMGYLNMVSGQMQVEPVYDALMAGGRLTDGYGEGLLIAVKDGRRGIVDTQGKELTAFEFDTLSEIPGGLIGHRVHDKLLFRIDEEQIVDTIPYVAPVPSLRPGDSLVGLGLRLKPAEESPSVLIEGVIPGGPAAKAGLQAGDLITAVDGHKVAEMSLQEVVTAIRGAVGTKVKLQIKRGAKTWALTVKRAAIVVQ